MSLRRCVKHYGCIWRAGLVWGGHCWCPEQPQPLPCVTWPEGLLWPQNLLGPLLQAVKVLKI